MREGSIGVLCFYSREQRGQCHLQSFNLGPCLWLCRFLYHFKFPLYVHLSTPPFPVVFVPIKLGFVFHILISFSFVLDIFVVQMIFMLNYFLLGSRNLSWSLINYFSVILIVIQRSWVSVFYWKISYNIFCGHGWPLCLRGWAAERISWTIGS